MAQALARLGASVALVEADEHVLPREPRALGEAVGEALAADGIELRLGQQARVPLPVLFDVIQPFPTFSEAFLHTLRDLEAQTAPRLVGHVEDVRS